MCNIRQRGDVADFGERIGRRFDEKQFGIGLHRLLPGIGIGQRHEGGFHPEALEDIAEQLHRGAEDAARGDDMVASGKQAHHASQDGGHAAGGGDAELRAFQRRQPLLQHADGRVGEARVDVARLLPAKTGGRLRCVLEHEAGSEEHRLGMLVELAADRPGADGQGFKIEFVVHGVSPQ